MFVEFEVSVKVFPSRYRPQMPMRRQMILVAQKSDGQLDGKVLVIASRVPHRKLSGSRT